MPTSDRDPMTPLPTWSLLMGGPTPSALPNQPPLASPSAGWWVGAGLACSIRALLLAQRDKEGLPLLHVQSQCTLHVLGKKTRLKYKLTLYTYANTEHHTCKHCTLHTHPEPPAESGLREQTLVERPAGPCCAVGSGLRVHEKMALAEWRLQLTL